MHILILNQTFHPDVAATAQLMWDLAQHLSHSGHRVSAITSQTIYGTDQRLDRPFERIGNIEIHRVPQTAFGKKHLPGRMADFLSFYLSAFAKLQQIRRPDVILALTSPPMIAVLGLLQRQFDDACGGQRIRLVYHVMDLYPEAAVAMGVMRQGSLIERAMTSLTRQTLHAADAILTLGRDMRNLIINHYGLAAKSAKIHVIPPWADGAALRPIPKSDNPLARELGITDTFNIVYSGNFGQAHDADTILAAIEQMRNDLGIRWLFIGGGSRFAAVKEKAAAAGWTNVQFLPYQDRDKLGLSLNLADVHLVSQLPAFTGIVVPSKLYGIMAVGKPTMMIGPAEAECSRVIEETGAGFIVPNGASWKLTERIRQLKSDAGLRAEMGRRAREAFERQYDRPIACGRIEMILNGLTSHYPPSKV
jgi:glycosyltransferase involved in cell wall biosynthesis